MSEPGAPARRWSRDRRPFDRWRLVSPTGAEVVSLRQLSKRERLRVTAPTIFTTLNMMSGLSSVLLAFRGQFTLAAILIAVSIVMDIADGGVARLVGATSPFGLQMDSLADLISFGLAPAVLVHTWALSGYPVLSWLAAFFWLGCAAFRLARFNVTVDPLADKRYFVGLPSPAAAAVVMATIFALSQPEAGGYDSRLIAPLVLSFVPAALMVTSIRFRSFRTLLSPRGRGAWLATGAVVLAVVVGLVLAPGLTGIVLAYGYVLQAPLGVLTAPLRERLLGPDSVAPRRERMPSVFLPDQECAEERQG
ncbi:CDP-diacylglycerol--serine O-phosphatidyltransferase [Knoellia remsis]|uniref:CDP-diacylglycerol--serine O-phosphatidyltransferase n=1 Tax=Knoellia remsis TaxID=407159 RepID=A0A2T0UUL1_9MICO|nr:CDP-diacylglycerol--serine O-phosphatidyltransferase [Knoellia remsis]PRY61584.1 CDP-diacylglycerol--serine O-phosphatidyltransferase [Knoellia remsis]